MLLREPGNLGSINRAVGLGREPQPELQVPENPDALHVVARASGAVNLAGGSRQQSIHRVTRQVKVREVEEFVNPTLSDLSRI